MENESMTEIEVMEDSFNLDGTNPEADVAVAPELAEEITEEASEACECECDCDCTCECEEEEVLKAKDKFLKKCNEVKSACQKTADRLKNDWNECGANAYIRETTTYKIELYKNREDTTPVDSYTTVKSNDVSLKMLALVGGATILLSCCLSSALKHLK